MTGDTADGGALQAAFRQRWGRQADTRHRDDNKFVHGIFSRVDAERIARACDEWEERGFQ
jgi:hypothetical protein